MTSLDVLVLRRNDYTIDGRVERQARSLASRGLSVRVLAIGGVEHAAHEQLDGYELERLPVDPVRGFGPLGRLPGRLSRRASTLLGTAVYYEEAVRRILALRPRVVHCHDLDTLWPGVTGANAVGAKVIYDSAELWVERNTGYVGARRRLDRIRYTVMERRLIRRADAVVTVSDGIADELASRYAIARPRLVRNVPARPTQHDVSLRQRVGGDAPILLHLGVVDMNRGLEETVRALTQLPDVRLVLMGTARDYVMRPLMQLAAEVGVDDRVLHIPPVPRDEIIAWAREADAALCTFRAVCLSHVLAMPNKLYEYAFAGVPIVASDFPDMGEFVRRHTLGTVCDPDSPTQIAAAVQRVLSGEVVRRTPEQVAAFIDAYAWESQFETLWDIYQRLL